LTGEASRRKSDEFLVQLAAKWSFDESDVLTGAIGRVLPSAHRDSSSQNGSVHPGVVLLTRDFSHVFASLPAL
jgi:hypothetical protein